MALGWLSLLKAVPWGDVIQHAPTVVDGARKLWQKTGRSSEPVPPQVPEAEPDASPEARALAAAELRIATLEQAVAELDERSVASTRIIKELAEQQSELIRRLDEARRQIRWLVAGVAVSALLAVGTLGAALGGA